MNQQIIFDTSVWIELIQRKNTQKALLLREYILGNKPIWLTPTIVQEVLQGSRNSQEFERLKNSLLGYRCLLINSVDAAIKAAQLYSSLHQKGVTIRKPNDCLIAIYALHFDIEICHKNIDFNLIAQNSSLKITII